MTNAEAARRRGISVNAVKFHIANALAKLGLKDRRALRAWFRVPRDAALANVSRQPMKSHSRGSIGQIARSVSDTAVSEKWYREVLRLPHLYTYGPLAFFDCGGTRLMLSGEGGAKPESILYLRVDDIVVAHAELTARGVRFTHAPHMIHRHADGTEEWMAFFEDPDARPMAIMMQAHSQPAGAG
jgi:catechol 2,3-dioxygenase-like lactoylglutathione lyase family enzyme